MPPEGGSKTGLLIWTSSEAKMRQAPRTFEVVIDHLMGSSCDECVEQLLLGKRAWFSASKGYGFLTCHELGHDVLLHENVLGELGKRALHPEAQLSFKYARGDHGFKVTEVVAVIHEQTINAPEIDGEFGAAPLKPACVKWFDSSKGFGFANTFKESEDIFVHASTVQQCGFWDLRAGEAICIRVQRAERGLVANLILGANSAGLASCASQSLPTIMDWHLLSSC
ncbi:Cold shock-like protein CspD [Nymphon striatum]|nr:Cold shock-like protein CspD [Nymphon striatum]